MALRLRLFEVIVVGALCVIAFTGRYGLGTIINVAIQG